jgi:hypothetical protein
MKGEGIEVRGRVMRGNDVRPGGRLALSMTASQILYIIIIDEMINKMRDTVILSASRSGRL